MAWPARVDVDRLIADVVDRVGDRLTEGVGDPAGLLDVVEVQLYEGTPPCPLSRATVRRVLGALPRVEDAPGGAAIIADAIRASLARG